jgi:hypothetical protein
MLENPRWLLVAILKEKFDNLFFFFYIFLRFSETEKKIWKYFHLLASMKTKPICSWSGFCKNELILLKFIIGHNWKYDVGLGGNGEFWATWG